MDGRNNQFNPQNTQNRQLTNAVPAELNHIIQNGVTPEQFAENARQLETYSRMNAMALQVYLQRQSQEAEQRRQDELRVIQLARQLASGSQQRLQLQQPPPPPPVSHSHHSLLTHQAVTSNVVNTRPTPVQIHNHGQPYNKANANNVASQHWSHVGRPQVTTVQPQHPQTVNTSAFSMNQNVYSPHEANRVSHPIRGTGSLLASAAQSSQIVQPPKAASTFVQQTPQYSQRSGIVASGSQANTGLGGASVAISSYGVNPRHDHLKEVYPSWVKTYGAAKAASMVSEYMHSWRQGRPINPMVPSPMQSTIATPIATLSAQNPHNQSHFQIPVQERTAPLPHPQTQEWHSSVPMTLGQQAASQPRAAAPSTHVPLPPPTDDPALNTVVDPAMLNATNSHNDREVQPHHPGAVATNPALTSTGLTSAPPALPSSQPGPTQSILLESEEKGSTLYSMRGLAASIKRSLNAERLAAAVAKSSPSFYSHTQKRERSSSAEAVDNLREVELGRPEGKVDEYLKAEPQPATLVPKPDESLSTMLPVSFSEEAAIPQQETIHTPSEFTMPCPPHESAQNFVPFSTLTGAVSFDDISGSGSASHNAAPSSEALEDLSTAHPTPEAILHNHIEVPIPMSQPSFDPLSFPHRTPTPPLAATITPFHDEDEVDEKIEATPSSHPSSVLHEEEIDSQLRLIPSGSEDDVEMRVDSGEDHAQAHFNIRSPSEYTTHSEARDDDSPMQETDVFVRRTGLLDSSTGEIDRRSMGSPQADEYPASEIRSPMQVSEEQRHVFTRASSTEVRSPGSGLQSRVSRRSRGKQEFYIAVPPPSEWVLRAKHREAERKALVNEKSGQHSNREYTECDLANRLCPRRCHWNGCQAVLNSMYALKQHVRRHQLEVKPVRPAMTVSCRWKQCRMVCERSSLLLHLNRHIDKGVACVYDDCDEQFSRIQELAEHEKSEHADDEPPPSAVPRPPDLTPLTALPQTVPSYTTTTRPASRPSITAERHARLGPWTLGMVIGHPTAGPDGEGSNTGLRARRTTRLTEQAPDVVATPPFDGMRSNLESVGQWAVYDVLEEACVGRGRVFGELDTVDVTREFYEGRSVRGEGRSTWSGEVSEDEDEGWIDTDSVAVEALL